MLSWEHPAYAQSAADRTTARSLAQEAQTAFDQGDFATAEDRFARAEGLVHAPTLLLALARSQMKLGKLVQAYENYQRVIREPIPEGAPDVWKEAQRQAQGESDAVQPRLGWVTIIVRGASDPRVTLEDGTIVPKPALGVKRAVNPGSHQITASAPGFRSEKTEFQIGEGQAIAVTIALEVDPNAPRPSGPSGISNTTWQAAAADPGADGPSGSQKTWGYVGLGVGGAGLIFGGVTGALAMSRHSALETKCPGGTCPPSEESALESYRSMGTLSTVGFVVGGLGTAAGLTLLLTAPEAPEPGGVAHLSMRLHAGFGSMSLEGSF
ncbi:MAG: hypothetical protein SFV15_09370 [Polyangiaceae bacterium]|nr:hypothetical protein [Polyangiaceae bacterium]